MSLGILHHEMNVVKKGSRPRKRWKENVEEDFEADECDHTVGGSVRDEWMRIVGKMT